jgi:hypothetical protein
MLKAGTVEWLFITHIPQIKSQTCGVTAIGLVKCGLDTIAT